MLSASRWEEHHLGYLDFFFVQTDTNVIFVKKIDIAVLKTRVHVLSLSEGISSDIYFKKGGIRYEVFDSRR